VVLAISAALVGAATQPRPVQVNVTGLTIGTAYTVTASSGTWSRPVQGGAGTATSTQVVLIDVATPLNAAVVYTVVHTSTVASSPVTVAYAAGNAVLQSLDGETVAGFFWIDNGDPREQDPRVAFFRPAGRQRPIMHYDVAGDDSGTLALRTDAAGTTALRELIRQGAPVLIRAQVGMRDIDPVDVLGIRSAPRVLVGSTGALSTMRRWDLAYTLVDDNDTTPLVMVTLANLNTYYATKYLSDINTQWSGQTLADLNAFDWVGAL
jgi:hypothetical protein